MKTEVTKDKQRVNDELYERLDIKEGEKNLYHLSRETDRAGRDVLGMKGRDGNVLTREERMEGEL